MPFQFRNPLHRYSVPLAILVLGFSQSLPAQDQSPIQSRSELRERIIDKTNNSDFMNNLRMALLGAVAFYPDEVIAAIFEVAQYPDALQEGQLEIPDDPEFKRAHEFLSGSPDILDRMGKHPGAVRILGEMAKNNLAHSWTLIDDLRAQYREKSGVPVHKAVTAEDVPPPVKLNSAGKAEGDVGDLKVVLKSGNEAYVKSESRPGFVYVYGATDTEDGKMAVVEKVIKVDDPPNQNLPTDSASSKDPNSLENPANWEPSDQAVSSPPTGFRESQVSVPKPRTKYTKPKDEHWDYYSSDADSSSEGRRSRYRRTDDVAESEEVYSGQMIDAYTLGLALERGLYHQAYVFDTFDSGGFQGPNHSGRHGHGFQGPNHTGEDPYGGFLGESDGIEFR